MLKKIIQYSIIAASIGVIAYVYYQFSKDQGTPANVYDAVPSNSFVVLEVKLGSSLNNYKPWLNETSARKNETAGISFNPASQWAWVISTLDSLRHIDENWQKVLSQSNVVLASTSQLRGDTWMMSIGLHENEATTTARELMKNWIAPKSTRNFKNITIHQGLALQYAVVRNCLVLATSNALMEDVIIRAEKKDLLYGLPNYATAHETRSADIPVHFFFRMDNGEWMQLDPVFSEGKISLSGYAVLNKPSNSSYVLTGNGKKFEVAKYLPDNTSLLDVYSYRDFETGWRKHEEYFAGTDASKFWGQAWKDYGDTCSCDLNDILFSWRTGEWGAAILAENDSTTSQVLFIGTSDSTDVIAKMKPLLREKTTTASGIYTLLYPQLLERNKPQTFLVEARHIMQKGNFVFLGSNPEDFAALQKIQSSLADNNSFRKSIAGLNPAAGRFVYQTAYYASPLPATLIAMLSGNDYTAASVEHFKDNRYLVQIALPYQGEVAVLDNNPSHPAETSAIEQPQSIENTLQDDARTWIVINHNTQQKEKLTESNNHELCLFGNDGKMLWKKKLEGKILGDVVQIDGLKNNKLQYAFATDKLVYIVDRNGNDFAGYPLRPKPPIASPLHIADYDKNKTYRLLFTSGDGYLNNYNIEGKKTIGWKGGSGACYITDFKIGQDDYILAVSADGTLNFLKRTGEKKHSPSNKLSDYDGKKCIVTPADNIHETTITYTTKAGEVKTIEVGR